MRTQNRWTEIVVGVVMGVLFSAAVLLAGSLEPGEGPAQDGSQMYTLEQIYNRINNGTEATKMTTFTGPNNGPTAGTMHTLDEIYNLAGQRAPVPRTGQTPTVPHLALTGSDGALQKGVAWPGPRFHVNRIFNFFDGTVTDNLTGLTWLRNANCFGLRTWAQALSHAQSLASGSCDLLDFSKAGDWRLPNVKELQSLIDFAYHNPALSNAAGTGPGVEGDPFFNVMEHYYWSSTTDSLNSDYAWSVDLGYGLVNINLKAEADTIYMWPVRGGQ